MIRISIIVAALFAGLFASWPAIAQPDDRSREIDRARDQLGEIRAIAADDVASVDIEALQRLRDRSRERLNVIDDEIAQLRGQIDALGPAPAEGEPPESEALASEREALEVRRNALAGQRVRVNANVVEANELLAEASAARVQNFYQGLLTRGPAPFAPDALSAIVVQAGAAQSQAQRYFTEWAEDQRARGRLPLSIGLIAAAVILAFVLYGPVQKWVQRTFATAIERRRPTPPRRIVAAGLKMIARAAPGIVGGFIVIETLRSQGLIQSMAQPVVQAAWLSLVIYLLVSGFLRGLVAPRNPTWRVAQIGENAVKAVSFVINAIVIVFGAKVILAAGIETLIDGDALLRGVEAGAAIIVSLLLFALCRKAIWRDASAMGLADEKPGEPAEGGVEAMSVELANPKKAANRFRIVRRAGRVTAVATALAALIGYVALADFIASRIYFFAIIVAFAWFARALLQELAIAVWKRARRESGKSTTDESAQSSRNNVRFWSGLVINALLLLGLTPVFFVMVGAPSSAVRDGFQQALFGFDIGGVRIPSIAKIAAAILTFVAIIFATRFVQRGVREGPFAHSRLDPGVQNSFLTLIGYAGLVIAAFAAVSAVGFDLSNLALIAGALSVGIGFGLQSIVNNFVSGLILLFERPIKVGDWIVTNSGEGIVQKISVRSTEIQTWDRSSIIVPNSELISSTVTNWTHKNALGRVIVPVGVSYDSDPEQVRSILLQCAKDHPKILSHPPPFVVWNDFGASSLDFDLRGYVADIASTGLGTRTELRFAIFEALKKAGVEIPFPQRDLHIKSAPVDWDVSERLSRPDGQARKHSRAADENKD